MEGRGFRTATLSALLRSDGWVPIRRALGIDAFGVNAWHAAEVGDELVMEHVEADHQELYLVLSGRAAFTVGDEELEAEPGTLLFIEEPGVRRRAVAAAPDTTVLTVGAPTGVPFVPNAWETNREVLPLFESGDWQGARTLLLGALDLYRERGFLLYNLACAEAQLGNQERALRWLAEAIEARPELATLATHDGDLAPLHDQDAFLELTGSGR